ncbi:MAG: RimK/LysX family protein [Candidatus Woesearchaeota archaeon]
MPKEICFKNKIVLGLTETVTIITPEGVKKKVVARIDTGAQNSSIDQTLSAELKLGPIIKNKKIRQSQGRSLRPVISASCIIERKKLQGEFTIADRGHMRYRILIGQNLLKKGFIIDPNKYDTPKKVTKSTAKKATTKSTTKKSSGAKKVTKKTTRKGAKK